MTLMEIRAKCRRLKQRHDLRLVVVDYLQLMTSGKRVESRQQEVSEFSRSLKLLAKELEVPVIAISQLNRGAEQRTDKRPLLADLRECADDARAIPKDTTAEEVAFMASHIDPAQLDDAAFEKLLSFAGMTGAGVPESTAGINAILQALDPALRNAIMIHYLNDLFQ
jgi:replicative DNA helicase